MSYQNSPGAYSRTQTIPFVNTGDAILSAGVVISAPSGSTEPTVHTSTKTFIDEYGLPTRDNPSLYAAYRYLRRANFLTVVRAINDATKATVTVQRNAADELTVDAINEGSWGNNISWEVEAITDAPAGVFAFVVKESGVEVERFQVSRSLTAKNGFGQSLYIEDVVNQRSKKVRIDDIPNDEADYLVTTGDLVGGADDTTAPTSAQIMTAWDKFANEEEVDAVLLINAGWATPDVAGRMLSIAAGRKRSFAILDVPEAAKDDADAMVTYRNTTLGSDDTNGGLYGGWLNITDESLGFPIDIPCSGDVAANFSQAASRGEIWDPVMGVDFGAIPDVNGATAKLNEGQRDQLYTAGINPVTKIGGNSAVIFGNKTLQKFADGLDRVNVVMNVKDIDFKTNRAMLPFVGKTNTRLNRDNANAILRNFLETRKNVGGLYDYFVDTETYTTADVIDNSSFEIVIGLKPVKGMEFIRTTLVVTPTGVSFN